MNRLQCAGRAWPILTECAKERSKITYGDLTEELNRGFPKPLRIHWRSCRLFLSLIQDFCLEENPPLPPLTALVVQQATGRPGEGFIAWDIDDAETAWQRIYEYNWNDIRNPFCFANNGDEIDALVTRLRNDPNEASAVYALVRTRGIRQALFRQLLLDVYGSCCAMSGQAHEDILEAAHIVPWNVCTPEKRFDIRNGLLLSKIHHHLFDRHWFRIDWNTVTEKFDIKPGLELPPSLERGRFGNLVVDQCLYGSLNLPAKRQYWPDPAYIAERYSNER